MDSNTSAPLPSGFQLGSGRMEGIDMLFSVPLYSFLLMVLAVVFVPAPALGTPVVTWLWKHCSLS